MPANLAIRQLLQAATRALEQVSQSPQLDAQVLLAHALGVRRAHLQSHGDEERSAAEQSTYQRLIEQRAMGEPIAYIIGAKEFWSLELAVSPAVLVPRPETELLVERALARASTALTRVLDLGTGSGAIALALARERPAWQITATDVSEPALTLARQNARSMDLTRVEFLTGSWFEPLGERCFDLIVANPPYVAADDPLLNEPPLSYEPRVALSPDGDALADLRHIIRLAPEHLVRGGWLLLEHGATQAQEVARELVVRGFRHVTSRRDLAGYARMVEARWGDSQSPTA
jgi:release factor glutamine methyltransferase